MKFKLYFDKDTTKSVVELIDEHTHKTELLMVDKVFYKGTFETKLSEDGSHPKFWVEGHVEEVERLHNIFSNTDTLVLRS